MWRFSKSFELGFFADGLARGPFQKMRMILNNWW
nr:MAG TPA: hypothetical protein [Caudoviricetes sp.]